MLPGSEWVFFASTAFVGTHFALSHPLRRPLVRLLGEPAFAALYSIVAVITLGAAVWAYVAAPIGALLWGVGNGLWAIATVAMLVASILLMGSLVRNPALPGAAGKAVTARAVGVYGVTRHPMMWSFALWGASHILVFPAIKNLILSGAIIFLALVGAAMQDRKKIELDPRGWAEWEKRTSYLPFAAIATGRTRLGGFGAHAIVGGMLVWLGATWAHAPLSGWPAGIWLWI